MQAPPPPIHKYPSWEDRIYQVASDGIKTSSDIVIGAQIDSRNNNNLPHGQLAGGYGTDINVPVYATVKGVSEIEQLVVGFSNGRSLLPFSARKSLISSKLVI